MTEQLKDDLPPLPAFSHFLETSTDEMQKDAIRAYAKKVVLADRASRSSREDEKVREAALSALEKCANWIAVEASIRKYGPNFMDEVYAAIRALGGKNAPAAAAPGKDPA